MWSAGDVRAGEGVNVAQVAGKVTKSELPPVPGIATPPPSSSGDLRGPSLTQDEAETAVACLSTAAIKDLDDAVRESDLHAIGNASERRNLPPPGRRTGAVPHTMAAPSSSTPSAFPAPTVTPPPIP